MPTASLVLNARATLGEGPIWDERARRLWWVDILAGTVHAFDPATGADRAYPVGEHVGTVVPRARGGLMLALASGFAGFDPASGKLERCANPEAGISGNRFNDGKCDPGGRFWAGTMAYDESPGRGSLWRLDPDGSVTRMIAGVAISNGLAWDITRRRFHYIDSPTRTIASWDWDPASGAISNRRVAVTCAESDGFPDGLAMDLDGKLWVAHWGGFQVVRWDPDTGAALERIRVPTRQPTACAFVGTRLYITSARVGQTAEQLAADPHAGGIFSAEVGIAGAPTHAFAG